MVSMGRLQWLVQQISRGRRASVRFSFNAGTHTEKVSFTLEAFDDHSRSVYRPCVLSALQSVEIAMAHCVVTDKGHTSSKGKSTVEFWLKPVPDVPASAHGVDAEFGDSVEDGGLLSDTTIVEDGDSRPDTRRVHFSSGMEFVIPECTDVGDVRMCESTAFFASLPVDSLTGPEDVLRSSILLALEAAGDDGGVISSDASNEVHYIALYTWNERTARSDTMQASAEFLPCFIPFATWMETRMSEDIMVNVDDEDDICIKLR